MLNIQTLTVGDLTANCYLVSDGDECIIIDPGDDADFITETITNQKLKPTAIILTHGHFDHVLGCLELKLNFNLPIYLHKNDEKLYTSANQSALHWLKKKTLKVPPLDHFIKAGDEVKVGNEILKVIETPGHTPGSICLYRGPTSVQRTDLSPPILLTGATLFAQGVGRTDFSYSSPLQLTKSLDRLSKFPGNTIVYPGHGDLFFLQDFVGQSEDLKSLE
ncbi:MAG: MBL fold metallo-hydrolase [Patescibacteria group bacterium]